MKPGDTFLVPDGIGTHLNCVLDVMEDGSIVLCHFTTCNKRSDRTCIIREGEHPFFNKAESVVRYDQVYVCSAGTALQALESLITRRLEPLSADLLQRVKEGALDSPQTPDKIKAILKSR